MPSLYMHIPLIQSGSSYLGSFCYGLSILLIPRNSGMYHTAGGGGSFSWRVHLSSVNASSPPLSTSPSTDPHFFQMIGLDLLKSLLSPLRSLWKHCVYLCIYLCLPHFFSSLLPISRNEWLNGCLAPISF